jgi:hypothetical protein
MLKGRATRRADGVHRSAHAGERPAGERVDLGVVASDAAFSTRGRERDGR